MSTNNATVILKGCLRRFKDDNDLTLEESEAFELFSLSQILKKDEDVSFENILDSITDGGNDGGIDSIIILHNGEYFEEDAEYQCKTSSVTKIIITQSKTEKSFKESSIDKLITAFPVLFDLEASENALNERFNSQVVEKSSLFKKLWSDTIIAGGRLEIVINYACMAGEIEISSTFESKRDQLIQLCNDIFSTKDVSFNCYSSKELLDLVQTHKKTRLTLNFKDTPLAISYGDNGLGYIGLIKLAEYKSFVTDSDNKINDELFESNIRHFQGKVDVNNKIRNTLENTFDRDFWWLNNGITIIAENPTQLNKKLALENVQVVNGLQTSFSIFNVEHIVDDDERSVLVKVIISNDKDVTDDIIESTNFQNAVSPGLLRATDNIQKEIELYFLQNGYFYDRRKNYYKNQGKPGNKIFSMQFLAQAIKSIILKDPHAARATPTSLLKSDSSYQSIFSRQDDYRAYLNCCLIVSKTHHAIINLSDKRRKNILTNFKLHIAMVNTALLMNKIIYDINEVAALEMPLLNNEIIERAMNIIESNIVDYQQENPGSNLINMAKSSDFTLYIKNNFDI